MARKQAVRSDRGPNSWLTLQIGIGLGLVALALVATTQRRARARVRPPLRDYSGRAGLPLGVEASRGVARDAPIPADMLIPDPLRPFTNGSPR